MVAETRDLDSLPPLTVDEFYALADREGWDEDTRLELLDGEIVWMNPVNDPHIGCVNALTWLFSHRYPADALLVSVQNPIRAGETDLPQPDLVLLRLRADHYRTRKATPSDVLLLVEVSDTTLRTDLGRKARIYADAGVPEYWVVDLRHEAVYVHRVPRSGGYEQRTLARRGESVSAESLPGVSLAVDEILG